MRDNAALKIKGQWVKNAQRNLMNGLKTYVRSSLNH